jgi:glucose-1-phosphate thymidylyltransferase
MKIILPVAGMGTRLRPHTHFVPKALLPVGKNNILGGIVDDLLPLNPSEFIFVTGYLADTVEDYINSRTDIPSSSFIRQEDPQGLGEAIHLCASSLPDDEPVLIVLGDTLFEADLQTACQSKEAILFTRQVEDPSRFGVAVTDSDNTITKLVEKPQGFVSDLALTGLYYFPNSIELKKALNHIVSNNIRTRGEYQLTDALAIMLEKGTVFKSAPLDQWLDCGKKETLLDTNEKLLAKFKVTPKNIEGVEFIEPVFIEEGAEITNSKIGPYVSVYKGSKISDSTISHSIIGQDTEIENSKLKDTVLSSRAKVNTFEGALSLGQDGEVNV